MDLGFISRIFLYLRMLNKAEIKFVRSLQQKESRISSGMFVAEGHKIVSEIIAAGIVPEMIIANEEWISSNNNIVNRLGEKVKPASEKDIERCSSFKTPQNVIAVCKIPAGKTPDNINGSLVLALDDVQDPGNTGTILRIAAWFGIKYILCSDACADLYNPKVIQASMGAFYKVNVIYGSLPGMLLKLKEKGYSVAGTFTKGQALDIFEPPSSLVVVMGNESRGMTKPVRDVVDISLTIPSFSPEGSGIESLNVSAAASILCYELSKKRLDGNCK